MTSQPPPSSTIEPPETDHINRLPDELLLLIFTKINNAKSLCICNLISKRFSVIVRHTPSIFLTFPYRNSNNCNDNLPKKLFNYLSKSFFRKPPPNNFDGALFQSAIDSLKSFRNVRDLRIELPTFHQDESVINWYAEFGRRSNVCVILFASSSLTDRQLTSLYHQIQNPDASLTVRHQSTSSNHLIQNLNASLTDHHQSTSSNTSLTDHHHHQSTSQIRNPDTSLTDHHQLPSVNQQIRNPDATSTYHHQSTSSNHQIQNPDTSLTDQVLKSRIASSNQCFREATWRQHVLRHVVENHRHTLETAEICDSEQKGKVVLNNKQQLNDLLDPEVKLPASGYGKLWHVQQLRLPESRRVLYGATVVAIRRTDDGEEECDDVGVKCLMKKRCDVDEQQGILWEVLKHILENHEHAKSLNIINSRR